MKPMLAEDWVEAKVRFPVIAQPKIDGVRSLNLDGTCRGRSLKTHGNRHVTQQFSRVELIGVDGEMAAEHETHPDLCRITSSALSTHEGSPYILWHLFDYVAPHTVALPYRERLAQLDLRFHTMSLTEPDIWKHLQLISWQLCYTLEELLAADDRWLEQGYEGTIIRDPNGKHKNGRSTVREGGLLRIKRFIEAEIVVTSIEEGERNANEAQVNELGHTFRSTHKANMVPNGMVGAMLGVLTKDVKDTSGKLLFAKGETLRVGAGKMTHDERLHYFNNPHLLIGQTVKFKLFPKGMKDKPRFPTFQAIRGKADQ